MTYCVAIKTKQGLVALADGRITAGSQVSTAHKMSFHGPPHRQFLIMTAGLRSVRDKTITYLERLMRERAPSGFHTMLHAAASFCECLRRVAAEDKRHLEDGGLKFDLSAILAGQLEEDDEPTLYLVYPEGNWIEVDRRTPYLSIGSISYGKPILDRTLTIDTPMTSALKLAYLSFDSSRVSSASVGFPVDIATLIDHDLRWREAQFEQDDLRDQRLWWNNHITQLVEEMPDGPWLEALCPPPLMGADRLRTVKTHGGG